MATKIDYERIAAAKEKFEAFVKVCDKVVDKGYSIQRACKEENINVQTFYNNMGRHLDDNVYKDFDYICCFNRAYELTGPDELMSNVMNTPWVAPDDFIELWEHYALKILTPREKFIIDKLYFEGNTLEEVSNDLSVTKERIRQIRSKAVRKLGNTSKKENLILRYGEDYITKLSEAEKEAYEEIERRKAEIEKEKNDRIQSIKDNIIDIFEPHSDLDDCFYELDLSVRSHNCIVRHMWLHRHLDSKDITIRVLAETPIEEYMTMRNLGRKSFNEIVEKLRAKYGVELKSDKEFDKPDPDNVLTKPIIKPPVTIEPWEPKDHNKPRAFYKGKEY